MVDLTQLYERTTGVPAPKRRIPAVALWIIAGLQETIADEVASNWDKGMLPAEC